MTCAKCQATVPEESLFCLRCGTSLTPTPTLVPRNGGGSAKATPAARPPAPVPAPRPAQRPPPAQTPAALPGDRQAYALSFNALADDRLRYRVARWVCEQAPAHGLGDVQESLTRGDFATFLALTAAEAETARQGIQALGAHPALWRLAPATAGELMLAERPVRPAAKAAGWSTKRKLAAVGIGLAVLYLTGMVFFQRLQPIVHQDPPTTPPTIGGRP